MPATKEQIADAFERHVQRFGYGKASVEDVAAELGISKRTIYQHFSSKRALYAYIVDRVAEKERARLEALIADEPTWRAKTERFLREVLGGMRVHIQETSKADWMAEFELALDAMTEAYGTIGTELVRRGHAAGEFTFADARLANAFIGAIATRYGVIVREERDYDADEAVVAAIMRMLGRPDAPGEKEE
ncbi:MAG: TetR/AcrR family transcriptional regulator [Anaerosomatales bacterium]|nr:TetR/AcrR family transcriptional regulator [Anaerosomatales bacterium]